MAPPPKHFPWCFEKIITISFSIVCKIVNSITELYILQKTPASLKSTSSTQQYAFYSDFLPTCRRHQSKNVSPLHKLLTWSTWTSIAEDLRFRITTRKIPARAPAALHISHRTNSSARLDESAAKKNRTCILYCRSRRFRSRRRRKKKAANGNCPICMRCVSLSRTSSMRDANWAPLFILGWHLHSGHRSGVPEYRLPVRNEPGRVYMHIIKRMRERQTWGSHWMIPQWLTWAGLQYQNKKILKTLR